MEVNTLQETERSLPWKAEVEVDDPLGLVLMVRAR